MESDYKIVRLLRDHIPGAIEVLRHTFFRDEKISNCVRILEDSEEIPIDSRYKVTKASKEVEGLLIEYINDGVSLCAVDSRKNEILGVAINKIQVKPRPGEPSYLEQYMKDHFTESSSRALMEVLIDMDSRYDFFGDEGNCFFEVGFLSVKSTYRGRGIGTALVTESAKLAETMKLVNGNGNSTIDLYSDAEEYKNSRALKMAPACVAAIFTSRFSQECGRRSGFVEVVKVSYTEFVYKGKKFSEITGADHPFCKLAVKVLP